MIKSYVNAVNAATCCVEPGCTESGAFWQRQASPFDDREWNGSCTAGTSDLAPVGTDESSVSREDSIVLNGM